MNRHHLISIIIPVYNEEQTISGTLAGLRTGKNEEIIVVDGGSSDRTVEIAMRFNCLVLSSDKGRGPQMNHGAAHANGDILFFLHADCRTNNLAASISMAISAILNWIA